MNKDHTPESSSRKTKGNFVCPNCGSRNIQTSQKQYCFPYGVEENQVELSTEVPVRICAGGLVIQNQAYDNYLYLLGFPKNLDRIRSRDKSGEVSQLNVDDDQGPEHQEGIMLRNIPPGSPSFHCVKLAS